jgi:hypothetical protein
MILRGLHLLLTYQCTFECDHCFVWGSPFQDGTMTLPQIQQILQQASELGTVDSIYFEGGEPFLYYATLLRAVQEAHARGFQVGVVSNAYWATSLEDALAVLRPFAGLLADLSVSSDLFHYSEMISRQSQCAAQAAQQLGIPLGVISIARPERSGGAGVGQIPEGESGVMMRGRAALKLAGQAPHHPWQGFDSCPHEDLVDPGRVHIDPPGYLHLCQGITIGNLFEQPLKEIAAGYQPARHPIAGPLLQGGPAALVREYHLPHKEAYADACHLCYTARLALRARFPAILAPDQIYQAV